MKQKDTVGYHRPHLWLGLEKHHAEVEGLPAVPHLCVRACMHTSMISKTDHPPDSPVTRFVLSSAWAGGGGLVTCTRSPCVSVVWLWRFISSIAFSSGTCSKRARGETEMSDPERKERW